MLSRLFKSRARFDDPHAEVRCAAVLALSDEEALGFQADLAELARADGDTAVRRAALGKLQQAQFLEPFLTDPNPEIVRCAAESIARDVDAAHLLHHAPVRAAAIRIARDLDAVAGLIGDVGFDHELIRLAVESRHPKVRVAVADKLMKESSLIELERLSRERDKNVNRLARTRLDVIKQARAEVDRALRRAEELTHIVETQLKPESDPLFAARFGVVKHDWHANIARHAQGITTLMAHGLSAPVLTTWAARFEAGVARAEAVLPVPAATAPALAEAPPAVVTIPTAADAVAFEPALAGLVTLLQAIAEGSLDAFADSAEITIMNRRLQDQWLATADHRAPPPEMAERFHAVTHTLTLLAEAARRLGDHAAELDRAAVAVPDAPTADSPQDYENLWAQQRQARHAGEQLARTLHRINWPADQPQPQRLLDVDQCAAALAAFDKQCHDSHEALLTALRDVITGLEVEISAGNLAAATGLENDGRRILHCLPAATTKRVQGEFIALSARVLELKDWRTFATHPKREEFVTQMEGLVSAPRAPPLQAEMIRELREAWNALGPVTNHGDRRLFDRFNRAADTAFQPCRAYFDEQATQRKFNLEQRRKICAELDAYLNSTTWEHPDWRAAERILYAARDEWHKFHPVDRSAGRKAQSQFDGLTSALYERLKAEWDRNISLKQQLVTDAAAIVGAGTNPRDATDTIKTLQRRWKEVGVVPRRVDQRLWKEFRAACDAVFSQRDAARDQEVRATESHVALAQQLCEEFQRALEGADTAAPDAGLLNEFVARFQRLDELPRDAARRVETRFREIERGYRMLLLQAKHDDLMREVDVLYDVDSALAALECSVAAGPPPTDVEARLAAISYLDLQRPGPFAQRIELIRSGAALTDPATTVAESRRRLAIEMELAAGVETPREFQSERLALQVERLNAGMKHRRVMEEAPLQIAERWCRTGPVLEDAPELRDRFFRTCRAALE